MITREILEAQIGLYQKGGQQAAVALEKAKSDFNAFNGAIEACENLLRILGELEDANKEPQESSGEGVVEITTK